MKTEKPITVLFKDIEFKTDLKQLEKDLYNMFSCVIHHKIYIVNFDEEKIILKLNSTNYSVKKIRDKLSKLNSKHKTNFYIGFDKDNLQSILIHIELE